jgi:plasmid stability protein
MGTLTIRKLDDHLKTRLRVRAAHHGLSMEEEARLILKSALVANHAEAPKSGRELAEAIQKLFAGIGPIEPPDLLHDPILLQPTFGTRRK